MSASPPSPARFLTPLAFGILLGLVGYLIGTRQAQSDSGNRQPGGAELLAAIGRDSQDWRLNPEDIHHQETSSSTTAHAHSVLLALAVADHGARMLEGDPLHVFAIHRLREPWARWIGVCSQMGDANSGGGTGWPRMHRHAPFEFERIVRAHIGLLREKPAPDAARGPSPEKVIAMTKALALQREDYARSLSDGSLRASTWEMRWEQLHDCGAIWMNEIAPFLALLPTPVADALVEESLEALNSTLHETTGR